MRINISLWIVYPCIQLWNFLTATIQGVNKYLELNTKSPSLLPNVTLYSYGLSSKSIIRHHLDRVYTMVMLCKVSDKYLLSGHTYLPLFPYNSYYIFIIKLSCSYLARSCTASAVNTNTFSVLRINTLRTGDADLRFYITTVQDGWRKSAFLTRACFPCTIHLIMQYIEPVSEWSWWRMFIETWPHSELTFRHRASSI